MLQHAANWWCCVLLCVCVLGLQVYPVVVHWHWTKYGWLSPTYIKPLFGSGAIDFAGGLKALPRASSWLEDFVLPVLLFHGQGKLPCSF